MKLGEVFRFELTYQLRRLQTGVVFGLILVVAILFVRGNFLADALYAEFYVNAPFIIAAVTVLCSLFWLIFGAGLTGEVAARDAETGMAPLTHTSPLSKLEYLGGRYLAVFALGALMQLAVPLGVALAVYGPGVDPAVVGPFRPAAYLAPYAIFALPTALLGTAVPFAWATLSRRSVAAFVGSVMLLFVAYGGVFATILFLNPGNPIHDLARVVLDAFGHLYMTSEMVLGWTPAEKNVRLITLDSNLFWSRLTALAVAIGALGLTYTRFRFVHATGLHVGFRRRSQPVDRVTATSGSDAARPLIDVPRVARTFGAALRLRQAVAVAAASFRALSMGRGGLGLLVVMALLAVVVVPQNLTLMGTPLLPATSHLLTFLTTPMTNPMTPWVVVPLLIVYWAGDLVWRAHDAGLGELTDAMPVPDGVRFAGRWLGLAGMLAVWVALLVAVVLVIQLVQGYHDVQLGLSLIVLFGLQLPEYLLFATLALAVQSVIGQKYVGHFVALLVLALILFAGKLGLRHPLLVYGAGPGWSYNDMRGFGASLGPWAWLKAYWAAWALLLAVGATALGLRGLETGWRTRLRLARDRFTRPTTALAALALVLLLGLGGFVFYNTNVRHRYASPAEQADLRAEYERRYGRYATAPQPSPVGVELHLDLQPERQTAEIRGVYRLVNRTGVAIDTIHVATLPGVATGAFTVSRPLRGVMTDDAHGHRIYTLATPLRPGDSLRLGFSRTMAPNGFRAGGPASDVVANGTWLRSVDLLPMIGYQSRRELFKPADRRTHGLPARPILPTLDEAEDVTGENHGRANVERIAVETTVRTAPDQIAIAPGVLRRRGTERGRNVFRYATTAPIGSEFGVFSARYAVQRELRHGTPLEFYYHPAHRANVDRMLQSVRASFDLYTRQYGPYAHGVLRIVENPVRRMGAHADASTIDYGQGFALFDPTPDPEGLDLPFAVMAHEMGHEWGVSGAYAEGGGLVTESFAWYAALGVVEAHYGREHLRRLLRFFRQPHPVTPIRQSLPLLRAMDPYAGYRKGPFALYAMSEYAGKEQVDRAFRRLIETHRREATPATARDLYRELQVVTPDSLRPLLHDLFEANTFWDLETTSAKADSLLNGRWRVTLVVRARKVTVAPDGVETEHPMDGWVPVGVFAPTDRPSAAFGQTLYLQPHRIRSGEQTITVEVPGRPANAGIDPYVLLIDLERFDNVRKID